MALYKVEICGVNTSKLPLLTEKEKDELIRRVKSLSQDNKKALLQILKSIK